MNVGESTYRRFGIMDSDSVNLGSNPSSPATHFSTKSDGYAPDLEAGNGGQNGTKRARLPHDTRHSDKLPCGGCRIGTYCISPLMEGLRSFGACASRKDALKAAPRCTADASHICFGARDWISAAQFPMSEADRADFSTLVMEA